MEEASMLPRRGGGVENSAAFPPGEVEVQSRPEEIHACLSL